MSVIKDVKASNGWKVHMERYNSAHEVVDMCKKREITNGCFQDMQNYDIREDWHGVKSYDEALEFMRTGYQPIVDKMSRELKATVGGESTRFGFVNDVHGFAPIVPLALRGVPNSMINMKMKPIKAKVVDIYYDSTFNSMTTNEEILECGRKILSVVMALEKQGYRFNLYAVQSYNGNSDKTADMLVVKVKSAEQPVDLKRISFPIAHTAFFRVIGFDWYSKVPGGKYRSGYGQVMQVYGDEHFKFGKEIFGKNAVFFKGKDILRKDEEYIKEVLTNER